MPRLRFRPELLFRPDTVGVFGATPVAAELLATIRAGGFAGTLLDAPDAASVGRLPLAPDLAVVASEAEEVAGLLAALGARGTRAAVVPVLAPDLGAAARAAGVRTFGPGSFGIAVPALGLNATRGHIAPPAGRVALVSQSAALCRVVIDWAGPNGVGFSHVIGVGGNADIGFAVALDWLAADPGTGLILLDIRRIRDPRTFLSAARACARLRPVVAIRAGGRLLDAAGEAEATFAAALRRAGVLSVATLEDLLAAAETLTRAAPLRREGLAIVTNAVGPGQLAADAALREGIALAALSEAGRAALEVVLPDGAAGPGPVYAGLASPLRLAEAAAMLAGAPEVGAVLAVHAPAGRTDSATIASLAAGASRLRVPLLVAAMGESTGAAHRTTLAEAGVPAFASPEAAVRGMHHLIEQRRAREAARELPDAAVLALAPDRRAVRVIFERARAAGRLGIAAADTLAALAAYGVPGVPGRAAATPQEAADAARMLGFPAVVKLHRDGPLPPVTGSVVLDLADAAEVERAAAYLLRRRGDASGVLVQRQVGRARALRLRLADDPVFGPAIGIGLAGVAGDRGRAFDLPPLNLTLARTLIARSGAKAALAAGPDQPAADVAAVAETLVRVSALAVDFPEIVALVLDPVFADADGVLLGNGWLRLRPEGETAMLSIPPYPDALVERLTLGGEALVIRPIRPEDAAAHAAMFARLPPEDVRLRFFSSMRELGAEQIARMTQVDYEREMALIAVRVADGATVGVARLVREATGAGGEAEFAVLVEPAMKGRGLATALMRRLLDWARGQGVAEVMGQVLAENEPMLAFVQRLGFSVRHLPHEAELVEARLVLG
ncbi:MAG TPA: GNAT family N-acetyltransferase [Acetobacteraceae bacterium]|nr:GNAT family N-acetyltransferase [Acetobacteraceae bacterium]